MSGHAYNQGSRSGQALVLVVLLMMAVILVGILFVAMVSYNQESGTLMSDRMRAEVLANAGLQYADYMLTYSQLGADWRPPFKPYDSNYDSANSATWPVPPVYLGAANSAQASWTATPNLFGPDSIPFSDDDYYMEEEVTHGWAGLVDPNGPGAPGPTAAYYVRRGFTRYPDPNSEGNITGGPLDQVDLNQGHFLLRVSYDPNPPFEGAALVAAGNDPTALQPDVRSKYLKIECVGVVAGTTFVWKPLVAYKAIGLTDHVLWVTDKAHTGRPALLGFGPWTDLDNSGSLDINASQTDATKVGDFLVSHFEGPMRFNCPVELRGDNAGAPPTAPANKDAALASTQIDLWTAPRDYTDVFAWRPDGGGYLRDDFFQAFSITEDTMGTDAAGASIPGQSTTANIWGASLAAPDRVETIWDSSSPNFDTYGGRVRDNDRSNNPDRNAVVDTLNAPDLFARDPATGQSRYYSLTRDSGAVVQNTTSNETVNVGRYGHGRGIYVDNLADLQFVNNDATHDLDTLMQDWLGNMANNDPRIGDSGWNATHTMYVPRGLEITLYNSEFAALDNGRLTPVTAASPGALQPNEVWWPGHVAGEPGIKLVRRDQRWRIADPATPATLGDDSGVNVMYVDYPPAGNQVILAEGNVRIKGSLPRDDPSKYTPAATLATGKYNLTVVSGGTIYVEGQILSPQDVEGRYTAAKSAGCPDEENSYLALLAHDCVALNPTQIVPVLTEGAVTAAPDDSASPLTSAQHWELRPTLGGDVYSRWTFGEPPTNTGLLTGAFTPDPINLVPYHTGEDPGPSAFKLSMFNSADNTTGWYDFNPVAAGGPLFAFLFAPTGSIPAAANVSDYLSPLWLTNSPLPLNGLKAPQAPLTQYISITPGDTNLFGFYYQDPTTGMGGTNYWLKKFKIEELDQSWGYPKGAVHAKVNALMYAQEGCFFIIPGPLFDETAQGQTVAGAPRPADRFRRFNYDLEIRGAITENFHASPAAWREWQDHWAVPQYFNDGGNPALAWGTIRYRYDETMLASRAEPATVMNGTTRYGGEAPTAAATNLPKLPLLPTCPGLLYRGAG